MPGVQAKILIVADFRGWAWDHKARNLRREFQEFGIEADIVYFYDYCCDPKTGWHDIGYSPGSRLSFSGYDATLFFSVMLSSLINDTLDMRKAFVGICSHVAYNGRPGVSKDLEVLNSFEGVFVVNRILFAEFRSEIDNLFYCPNGVDTRLFAPAAPLGVQPSLIIGWVGDPSHACQKGFFDVIQPAISSGQHRLLVADKENAYRSYDRMPDFYNSIEVYVCASLSEGTPNPCLEAAACGRPVLTTPVGNMPEFILPGHNGFFIHRSPASLVEYLDHLNENRDYLRLLGENARNTALEWDWSRKALGFVNMLSSAIPIEHLVEEPQ